MARTYTVGEINRYVRRLMDQDFLLRNLMVCGEVSNLKYHSSGHIYFSLKDEGGQINAVMFAGNRRGLAFAMKNGDKVVVTGSITLYETTGQYQLYARQITLEGAGNLYERYLALKQELSDMGMFDAAYKQPIPRFVRRLGVVTAPTGAAVQDIRNIALRRNPYVQIILYPAQVQGEGAKESICRGIRTLDEAGVDVIIVGRGGGSIEDLWAFNEECVARAIFECRTPVISAVGHETDTTIADFVSDLRAPTPSAGAELAVMDVREYFENLSRYRRRLDTGMRGKLGYTRQRLEHRRARLSGVSPEARLRQKQLRLADLQDRLTQRMERRLSEAAGRLETYIRTLDGLSPINRLSRGYSYVSGEDRSCIRSIRQVKPADRLHIRVTDGEVLARVEDTIAIK